MKLLAERGAILAAWAVAAPLPPSRGGVHGCAVKVLLQVVAGKGDDRE